jgi:hypothetical protein
MARMAGMLGAIGAYGSRFQVCLVAWPGEVATWVRVTLVVHPLAIPCQCMPPLNQHVDLSATSCCRVGA